MTTDTLVHQRPEPARPTRDHAVDTVVPGEVSCECGYHDYGAREDDPTAFLDRSLRHLERYHPDVLDQLIR